MNPRVLLFLLDYFTNKGEDLHVEYYRGKYKSGIEKWRTAKLLDNGINRSILQIENNHELLQLEKPKTQAVIRVSYNSIRRNLNRFPKLEKTVEILFGSV